MASEMVVLVCVALMCLNLATCEEEIRWDLMHQTDYDVIPHHIETKWVNKSYLEIHQLDFIKYNRTYHRVLNASGVVLKEIGLDFLVHFRQLKFVSNTYKYFPIVVTVNLCKEWKRNTFKIQDLLAKYSNLNNPCPLKPGPLWVKNGDADASHLPPYMPHGDYKGIIVLYNGDDKLIEVWFFSKVVPGAGRLF